MCANTLTALTLRTEETARMDTIKFTFKPNGKPRIFLAGSRFGRLLVESEGPHIRTSTGKPLRTWDCLCDCGNRVTVITASLVNGRTKSCGCWNRELASIMSISRKTHGDRKSKEYNSWVGMLTRCYNQNDANYHHYGGRGISVCEEWRRSYADFLAYMGRRPTPKHSIDRWPDMNGNYEPGNVRWATQKQQVRNTRASHMLVLNGRKQSIGDWADELHMKYGTLQARLQHGWTDEEALTIPIGTHNQHVRRMRR